MRRRSLLLALPALPACSVLPSYDYVEPKRFPLVATRPGAPAPGPAKRVLLIRLMRAAPGMDSRGLRSLRSDGTVALTFYAEWTAPPAELAEEALHRWLGASGRFSAVTSPGSRARPDLVLESELTTLVADLGRREARAGFSVLLLRQQADEPRPLRQFAIQGRAPLPAGDELPPEALAEAMNAAFADALAALERSLARYA
ncbi:ABC-type transport auxiliary lipoprotein family protein [Teichococcus oryzae]|nr:ABC-type transport auxiliary lipoprotein family protein [Pseudoroseomonas oryzae]